MSKVKVQVPPDALQHVPLMVFIPGSKNSTEVTVPPGLVSGNFFELDSDFFAGELPTAPVLSDWQRKKLAPLPIQVQACDFLAIPLKSPCG